MSRAVITGVGLATPISHSFSSLASALVEGYCGIKPIDLYNTTGCSISYAGQCMQLDTLDIPNKKIKKLLNRKDLLNVLAATSAMSHSGFLDQKDDLDPLRGGVFVGSCSTQIDDFSPYFESALDCIGENNESFNSSKFGSECLERINPLAAMKVLMNGGLAHISQLFNAQGVNGNIINGDTSGLEAIIAACQAIERQEADWCIAGAVSAPIEPFQMSQAFHSGLLAQQEHASESLSSLIRPYSNDPHGTCLGEGAVYFIIENEDHAKQRNAKRFGSILGYGLSNNGNQAIEPDIHNPALVSAIKSSYDQACLTAKRLSLIGGQGNGTYLDKIEQLSFEKALGPNDIPVICTSPLTGYLREANGPFTIAAALSCFNQGVLPQSLTQQKSNNEALDFSRKNCLVATQSTEGPTAAAVVSS